MTQQNSPSHDKGETPVPTYRVRVDIRETEPLRRVWRYVGYDEANYTYTPQGRALLDKLGRMGDAPTFIRCHFLLCTGEGQGAAKWGFTNVYREDDQGRPVYDWTLIDRILDAIVQAGCVPFVELGFMPEALTSAPAGAPYPGNRGRGWRYPPRDYGRWMALMRALARHCRDRYGLREVSRWYWELWNEPDISYWAGTPEAYHRLFDYTEWGIHSTLPQAKLGGPATTSPGHDNAGRFLRSFLTHCTEGENEVTGQRGTRLDFISFHTKGGGYGREPDAPKKTPTLATLFGHIDAGLEIVRAFPELRQHEIILSECDPDGWAAGTTADNPNLFYRNTEYYASYVAAAACHLVRAYDNSGPRVDGMLTWAFQFEGRDTFAGSRALSTNGVDKPILNVFRLLGRLGRTKLSLAVDPTPAMSAAMDVGTSPALTGIAAGDAVKGVQLLLVAHHDDWDVKAEVDVEIEVAGLSGRVYEAVRWDLDRDHANAHTAWVEMGRPRSPDPAQMRALQAAAALHPEPMARREIQEGTLTLPVRMRAHSVLLLELRPHPGKCI